MLRNETLIKFVSDIKNVIMCYIAKQENLRITPQFSWPIIENSNIPEHRKTNIGSILILCQIALFENHSILSLSKNIKNELENNWYTGTWFRTTGNSLLRTQLNLLLDYYLDRIELINHSLSNSVEQLNSTVLEFKEVINENQTVIKELESHLKEAYQENAELQNKIVLLENNTQNQTSNPNLDASYNNNNRLFNLNNRNNNGKKDSTVTQQESERVVFR